MPVLKHCIVLDDKVYCLDATNQKFIRVELRPVTRQEKVPDEAIKLISMKICSYEE